MARLNYQKLVDAGYDDRQIQQVLQIAKQKGAEVYNQPSESLNRQMTPTIQERIKNVAVPQSAQVPHTPQQAQTSIVTEAQKTILPEKFPITQEVGNYNPALYRGINKSMTNTGLDIGTPSGTEINLPEGQWVVEEQDTGWNRGYGNSILFRDTRTGEKLRFSHLSRMKKFELGQIIEGGLIGLTGETGHTTAPHLDLEMYTPQGRIEDITRTPYGTVLFPK